MDASRVVLPLSSQKSVLEELHETHLGVSKMKALARSYIWWPKMDTDIETLAKKCTDCKLITSYSSTPSMGMASSAMEQTTFRLC